MRRLRAVHWVLGVLIAMVAPLPLLPALRLSPDPLLRSWMTAAPLVCLWAVLVGFGTVGVISALLFWREGDRRTADLLLITPLKRHGILLGKPAAALVPAGLRTS
jgi:hypothetical protein